MNLEKALSKEALKLREKAETENSIIATNRLIADKGAEDLEMIRNLGMSSSITIRKEKMGRQLHLAALQKKYKKVYTIEEIETVALKYGLRFLRSDKYKGEVDPELPAKIREFAEEDGVELNDAKLSYNFYILAPYHAFELADRPKPRPIDPCIFYKISENHYRLVYQWGKDFTILRLFIGWKNASYFNFVISLAVMYFLVMFTFLSLLFPTDIVEITIVSIVLSPLIAWGRVGYLFGENQWRDQKIMWRSDTKNAIL